LNKANNRRALTHAFDKATALRLHYGDEYMDYLLAGPCSPSSWSINPDLEPLRYDPDKAKSLSRGSRPSKPLKLLVSASGQTAKAIEVCKTFINNMEKSLGLKIVLDMKEKNHYIESLRKGDFDLAYMTWVLSAAYDLHPIFHSQGFSNYGNYNNEQVDVLLDEIEKTRDINVMNEKANQLQELIQIESPHIFLWSIPEYVAYNTKIQGIDAESVSNSLTIFDYVHFWWIPIGGKKINN